MAPGTKHRPLQGIAEQLIRRRLHVREGFDLGADATRFPFPLIFPQDAHERLLIEQLEGLGVRVERRTELLRFEQDEMGVRATLRGPDGGEQTCEAAVDETGQVWK